ncbi:MAG TPA: hypothetical protein DCF92_10060 [Idiomarina sp.]|nr:hypothetical protein [Idiomarina sp.]
MTLKKYQVGHKNLSWLITQKPSKFVKTSLITRQTLNITMPQRAIIVRAVAMLPGLLITTDILGKVIV